LSAAFKKRSTFQLYHGIDTYGLAGAWLSDALNTNNHTFEVAPVFIVVEKELMRYVMSKFGWNPKMGDGITSPGGSMSNFYGMVLARYFLAPGKEVSKISMRQKCLAYDSLLDCKTKGLFSSKPLVIFTSGIAKART